MVDGNGAPHIDQVVRVEIERLLRQTGRAVTALADDDRLADLGITSLDVVDLVAALNQRLAVDPFRQTLAFTDVQTVEDLCRAYRLGREPAERPPAPDLETSRQRALARRAARRE